MPPLTNPKQLLDSCGRWLKRSRPPVVGLDIGSTSIKAVLAKAKPRGFEISAARTVPLSPAADSSTRAAAVRRALEGFPLEEANVIAGIGGAGTIFRPLLLPKMSPQELKGAFTYEAEKYIPFKLDEVFLDFAITGQGSVGQMEVILTAARKEVVQEYLQVLSASGTDIAVLDLEMLALANAWESTAPVSEPVGAGGAPPASKGGPTALLYIGARKTIVCFFLDFRMQFAREVSVAGDAFTQAVAESLQLDAAEAERIKCDPGSRRDEVRAAVQSAWEEWLGECRRSFDFYENQYGHPVERLVVGGGSARFQGLREWIQEATNWPVEDWDPLSGIKLAGAEPLEEGGGLILGVAFGLAIRGVAE